MDEVAKHNRMAWDRQAREECRWSIPVTPEEVAEARAGRPRVILTPDTAVPLDWLGSLPGRDLLCLASAGGQQAPLLAAAGATVTSLDLSEEQLALDQAVAEREGLTIHTEQGDMRDLSAFSDESFDLVVHVTSNVFCPEILPVWKECHRVLRPGGELLSGFMNPCYYLFDHDALERGERPVAVHSLPYSDQSHLSPPELEARMTTGEALEFSHSLDDQIGGQIRAGFAIVGFFEDTWKEMEALDRFFPTLINTRARKMRS